jgi:DinB superfamily
VSDPEPFERALHVLASTQTTLTALVTICQENRAIDSRVNAEAWSPRQVLAHLLVVERDVIPSRLLRLAEEDGLTFAPTAQPSALSEDVESLLREWIAERTSNLRWLRTLLPKARAHKSIHPRHGPITLDQHVVEWAYHDLDHLRQILGAVEADLYPHMGAWQSLYRLTD